MGTANNSDWISSTPYKWFHQINEELNSTIIHFNNKRTNVLIRIHLPVFIFEAWLVCILDDQTAACMYKIKPVGVVSYQAYPWFKYHTIPTVWICFSLFQRISWTYLGGAGTVGGQGFSSEGNQLLSSLTRYMNNEMIVLVIDYILTIICSGILHPWNKYPKTWWITFSPLSLSSSQN